MVSLTPAVKAEIHSQVWDGSYETGAIVQSILQFFPDEFGVPRDAQFIYPDRTPAKNVHALREAINQAQSEFERSRDAWERPTDCERLATAFSELDSLGIATLENVGHDNDAARQLAWGRVFDLESVGHTPRGFCYFHQQDVASAIDGAGLHIGFAANPPSDDISVQLDREAAVASQVVTELEGAGLIVRWDDPRKRIYLPDFTWHPAARSQWSLRGLRSPDDGLAIEPLLRSIHAEIRTRGDDMDLRSRFDDYFTTERLGQDLTEQWAHLEREASKFMESQRHEESTWHGPTDNDRLAAALQQLAEGGCLTRRHVGTTLQDGWAYMKPAISEEHTGALFFHQHDIIGAQRGQGLWLAFGAWSQNGVCPQRSVELATEACAALRANGLQVDWDGAYKQRIHLPSFEWRERRWTTAPEITASTPPKPHFLKRLFTTRPAGVDFSADLRNAQLAIHIERHVALADASAFNLGLFDRMRALGQSLGVKTGQPSNLGAPYCWSRTGQVVTFIVRSGQENLPAAEASMLLGWG